MSALTRLTSVRKRSAGRFEELVEDPGHGQHGGPRVDGDAAELDDARLTPRALRALEHLHVEARRSEIDGTSETAHASAHDRDALRAQ